MAVVPKRVNVSSSVGTLLTSGVGSGGPGGVGYADACIKNLHASGTLYLGGSAVTPQTGYPIYAGGEIPFGTLGDDDLVYGCTDLAGTISVAVLELQ